MGSAKEQPKVIGPASTLKLVAKEWGTSHLDSIPKGQHWVDLTDEGTVVVIEQPDGQSCAAIGGIMALRMKTRGVKGCVVGGRVRDLGELNSCGFPVSVPWNINVCECGEPQPHSCSCSLSTALVQLLAWITFMFLFPCSSHPSRVWPLGCFFPLFSPLTQAHHRKEPPAHDSAPMHAITCLLCFHGRRLKAPLALHIGRGRLRVYQGLLVNLLFLCATKSVLPHKDQHVDSHPRGEQVWARGQSTVGAGAEAKALARNIDISISGVNVSPASAVAACCVIDIV